jgi:meso-butanediol dehydrogenase / (S,S)-butanediol dehydrogenase / diacetyl reductase
MRFREKVAIVTGAKSGIGLATSRQLASEGADVVLADVRDASEEAEAIREAGGKATFVATDVSNGKQVDALFRRTLAEYDRLDILVNNAGIELAQTIADTSEAEWDRLMGVNLKGVFLCSRAAIPVMRRQGGEVIVNVASELALVGGMEIAAYCASKGGVLQLTKAMAVDAADGIRVNCVCPGPIETPLLGSIMQAEADAARARRTIEEKTLMKRLGRPDEIAAAIAFLAGDESSYMTGAALVVDGGWTAS